jgi:methylated-DNA-[protein]-cysteine S-methyltransferase
MNFQLYNSPLGELKIVSTNDELVACDWLYRKQREIIDHWLQKALNDDFQESSTEVIENCITQLEEYFLGKRKKFDLKLKFLGSAFQKKVWQQLLEIPYGKTISYEELSLNLGDIKAIRAVASANGQNPFAVIVPCHRVIGKNGNLTGYAGGLASKEKLLQLEGFPVRKQYSLF